MKKYIDKFNFQEGTNNTAFSPLKIHYYSHPTQLSLTSYKPSLCFTLLGNKQVIYKNKKYIYDTDNFLFINLDLPLYSKILTATEKAPFVCVQLEICSDQIRKIASVIKAHNIEMSKHAPPLIVGKFDNNLKLSFFKLLELLHKSKLEQELFFNIINEEILIHLLISKYGKYILNYAIFGKIENKIFDSIAYIKQNLFHEIEIDTIAKFANMSNASFFTHFKRATSLSPIQYQKRLRLMKAKELLFQTTKTIEEISFEVGYKSSSQFSREYSRLFKNSPRRDNQ